MAPRHRAPIVRVGRARRVSVGLGAAVAMLAATSACGSDGTDASARSETASTAAPDAPVATSSTDTGTAGTAGTAGTSATDAAADSVAVASAPAALQFQAPLVGGGDFDGSEYGSRPVAFWFWAPT